MNSTRRRLPPTIAFLLLSVIALAGHARAQGDQIAFTAVTANGPQIQVMSVVGTDRRAVHDGLHPAWSPDGRQIAYATADNATSDIAVVNADGTNAHRLTNDINADVQPVWSPDNTSIAFVSTRDDNADVYVIRATGGQPRRLTTELGGDLHPAWSPDGSRIAFTSTRDSGAGIYTIRADGRGVERLTSSALDWGPAWSPDGSRIAFASSRGGPSEIYVMDADGSRQHAVTSLLGADDASWSADGRRLVMSHGFDLYVLDLATGKTTRLTTETRETDPAWQPVTPTVEVLAARGHLTTQVAPARYERTTRLRPTPAGASPARSASAHGTRTKAAATTPVVRHTNHERSSISTSLRKPSELPFDARHVVASAVGAALLLLLVFPTNLFSNTFEEHYDEIVGRFGLARRRRGPPSPARRRLAVAAMTVAAALVGGFLDPHFGTDRASAVLVVSVLATFVLLILVRLGQIAYVNRRTSAAAHVRAFPGALAVGALTVVLSRALAFQPGYLLGNFTGTSAGSLTTRDKGRVQAMGLAASLASAFAAWGLWTFVTDAARKPHPSSAVLVADSFLAACFVGGLGSVFFALFPIRWLEGYDVYRYSRWLWLGLAAPTALAFVHVLLQPSQGSGRSMLLSLILFCAFGLGSVGFWAYFRYRPIPPETPPIRLRGRVAARARSGTRRHPAARGSSSRA